MTENTISPDDAFEVLNLFVQEHIIALQETGADAMRSGSYDEVQTTIQRINELQTLHSDLETLEVRFNDLLKVEIEEEIATPGRRSRVDRTKEPEFYLPLLQSLVELGGSAEINDVLNRVFDKMHHRLTEADFEFLPSRDDHERWSNTVRWARHKLVKRGLMKNDSPRGIWEISEQGREWLRHQTA